MTYLGLYAQQHRGQEGAGIVSLHEGKHLIHRGPGLVGEVFNEKILHKLKGSSAIGHTRYSTQGKDKKKNIQPLTAELSTGPLALSHNGNIVNFTELKKELTQKGSIFYSSSDTECLIHLLAQTPPTATLDERLKLALPRLEGAYSLMLLTKDSLTAVRDPMGFRPLVLGYRKWTGEDGREQKSWVVASETCAFDLIGAQAVREIAPGEIWTIDNKQGARSCTLRKNKNLKRCVFEYVYFARPDSHVFGRNVYQSRKAMGRILAEESPAPQADLIMPVPDSGVPSAIGYSLCAGIPYDMGIVRNHYIGRTFIHPSQSIRDFKVKIKLSAQKSLIDGKKVVVVDDSLVRGTTSKAVVNLLKQAGAKEIHFRVSSPPITGPCFYGVDTPQKNELIASKMSVEEIKNYLQVDSLAFLSHKGLMKAVKAQLAGTLDSGAPEQEEQMHKQEQMQAQAPEHAQAQQAQGQAQAQEPYDNGFCSACFTGRYPTATPISTSTPTPPPTSTPTPAPAPPSTGGCV